MIFTADNKVVNWQMQYTPQMFALHLPVSKAPLCTKTAFKKRLACQHLGKPVFIILGFSLNSRRKAKSSLFISFTFLHASRAEVVSLVLQALSARSNAPECHIGQAHRFRQKQDVEFGTGLFQHKGSLGPQGISTKPSLPSYSLGASTRDQMYKVWLHWGAGTYRGCKGGAEWQCGGMEGGGAKQLVGQSGAKLATGGRVEGVVRL